MIAKALRDKLVQKVWHKAKRRLSKEELESVLRAQNMMELDDAFFVRYHGFQSLHEYYVEMGAMGDRDPTGRIANVSVPLLVLHALDDPIAYWKALGDPNALTTTGKGYVMMLLTQRGGHVGWPTGWRPWNTRWEWMNNAASTFIQAAKQVTKDVNSSSLVDN